MRGQYRESDQSKVAEPGVVRLDRSDSVLCQSLLPLGHLFIFLERVP